MCPLTPARWRRIEQILDEAFELEPDERAPFVDRACAGEPELRAEVRALVAADRSAGAFLEPPITPGVAVLVGGGGNDPGAPESASAGERIGPYRVVRELGHGGMGAVYLAERADGQFEQRVALKLIRRDMTGDEVRRRFLQERQILAGLQHANIARLLDGGITSDGRPYFVMEHVEGVPITRYCDEHRLAVEGRLALFGRVCDAVRHAHERHVVHRDLKPANILVTATGELKLLDFGIAKPLDDVPGHHAAVQTQAGLHVMTPEYAAPEQIRLQPATAATDVYALGVVLYELLSGHPPYRVAGHSPAAVERVVCEQEPTRPSRMVGRAEDLRHADGRIEAITAETVSEARGTRPERLRRLL
ncbi:MAG TPA: serine/threonine-protein kinase, partial [Longimicrobiales bacterium]|nr:serine/threonine-protein kinase [Longimicrobiales bacterium]